VSLGIKFRRNRKENLLNAYEGEIVYSTDTEEWGLGNGNGEVTWREHFWDFDDNFTIGDAPYGRLDGAKHFSSNGTLLRKMNGVWSSSKFPMKRSDVEDTYIAKGSIPNLTDKSNIIHKNYSVKVPSWLNRTGLNYVIAKNEVDKALRFMENDGSTEYDDDHIPSKMREPITRGQTETGIVFKPSIIDPEIEGVVWMGSDEILRISSGEITLTGVTYFTQTSIEFTNRGTVAPNNFGYINIPEGEYDRPSSSYGQAGVTQVHIHSLGDRTSLDYLCYNLTGLKQLTIDSSVDFSQIVSMAGMFYNCSSLNNIVYENDFDSSNVTNMYSIFFGCGSLEYLPTGFSTDSATTIAGSFQNCSSLLEFPMVDLSNVTTFVQNQGSYYRKTAWQGCSSLTSFPEIVIPPAVTNISYAWQGCSSLKTFPTIDVSHISGFEFTFSRMYSLEEFPTLDFTGASSLKNAWERSRIGIFQPQNFSTITNFDSAFSYCHFGEFRHTDFSSAVSFRYAFYKAIFSQEELILQTPNVVDLTDAFFAGDDYASDNLKSIILDYSSATNLNNTFTLRTKLERISSSDSDPTKILGTNITIADGAFYNCKSLINPGFLYTPSLVSLDDTFGMCNFVVDGNLSFSFENATSFNGMCRYCDFRGVTGDIEIYSGEHVDVADLFSYAKFQETVTIEIDLPSNTSLSNLFKTYISSSTYSSVDYVIDKVFVKRLSPNFTTFYKTFLEIIRIIEFDENITFNNSLSFQYVWGDSIEELIYPNKVFVVKTEYQTVSSGAISYMSGMKLFMDKFIWEEQGLNPVAVMGGAFIDTLPDDKGFNWDLFWDNLPSRNWDSTYYWWTRRRNSLPFNPLSWGNITLDWTHPKAKNIAFSHQLCSTLPNGFEFFPSATSLAYYFYYMPNLVSVPDLTIPDSVTTVKYIFNECPKLETIGISDFKNVTDFSNAFEGCSSLVPTFMDMSSATDIGSAWWGCTSIINFPSLDLSSVTNAGWAWKDCVNMKTFPPTHFDAPTSFSKAFEGCSSIEEIYLDYNYNNQYIYFLRTFYGCSSLKRVACHARTRYNNQSTSYRLIEDMFVGCTELRCIKGTINTLSGIEAIPLKLFRDCPNLEIPNEKDKLDIMWQRKIFTNNQDCEE